MLSSIVGYLLLGVLVVFGVLFLGATLYRAEDKSGGFILTGMAMGLLFLMAAFAFAKYAGI